MWNKSVLLFEMVDQIGKSDSSSFSIQLTDSIVLKLGVMGRLSVQITNFWSV